VPVPRLESERLVLRPWSPDEAEAAFRIYGDPEVARWLSGVPEASVETQRAMIAKVNDAYDRLPGGYGWWALEPREGGPPVGTGLLKPLPHSDETDLWRAFRDGGPPPPVHEIEVGWHLAREAWGRGFATEAARRLLDHGFGELGLAEVHAVLYAENERSARVAGRLGMTRLGPTDRFYGVTVEHYVLRRPEWQAPAG
jgi:[ribosomal protein S5]-alanine N-acetyltransferase